MCGYIPGAHSVEQLVVGKTRGGKHFYVEAVKNGFVPVMRRRVFDAIKGFETDKCSYLNLPEKKGAHSMDREKMKTVRRLKPRVLCEVAFTERTASGYLRHPRFLRLRDDFDRRRRN